MEPRICELREDYALRKIPTGSFAANALYLEIIRLAYNLVTAFQRNCLQESWQSLTLEKLRYKLFLLPGQLTRPRIWSTTYSAKSTSSNRSRSEIAVFTPDPGIRSFESEAYFSNTFSRWSTSSRIGVATFLNCAEVLAFSARTTSPSNFAATLWPPCDSTAGLTRSHVFLTS